MHLDDRPSLGPGANGATAAEALSRNSADARTIIAALKKAGIDSADIQTTQVSLWPQTSNDGTRITGYQASNSVQVTAALGRSGELVDAAVRAGANNVDGPSLDTADKASLYNAALKKALDAARVKAQAIAAATGLTLGTVLKVHEGGAPTPIVYAQALEDRAAAPPIEAGTQKIEASVTVTFSAAG